MLSLLRTSIRRSLSSKTPDKIPPQTSTKTPEKVIHEAPPNSGDFYKHEITQEIYLNPSLSPPPRGPETPDDFRHPEKLGHWQSLGFDWTNPIADRYYAHEAYFVILTGAAVSMLLWAYGPDYKYRDWSLREAFLRTHRREALGLPLIEKNYIDPERIVLPTEEELAACGWQVTW